MNQEVPFRKVSIQPIELLKDAMDLIGDQYWLFVGITFVGMLISSMVPMGILMGPMMCGIHLCFLRKSQNQPVSFDLLFKGFEYFVESLIAMLVMMGVSLVLVLPACLIFVIVVFGLVASAGVDGAPLGMVCFFPMFAAFMFLILLAQLPFLFVFTLIVDRNLKAIPAVKTSFAAVWANMGGLMWMVALYSLISIVAACLCYVPAFLFMPLSIGATFLAYRQIFPVDKAETAAFDGVPPIV